MNQEISIPEINLPDSEKFNTGILETAVIRRTGLPVVAFRLVIKGGASGDPDDKAGMHRLTAKLLQLGSADLNADDFALKIESTGGSVSVHTTYDAVVINGQFLTRDLEMGFELLAGMLLEPRFDEIEFTRQLAKTSGDIASIADEPQQVCGVAHNRNLYGSHPYGRRIIGYKKSLDNITRNDVIELHGNSLLNSPIQLTVAGDVETEWVRDRIEKLFSIPPGTTVSQNTPEVERINGIRNILVEREELTQAHIRIGGTGCSKQNPDLIPLKVASTLFGGSFTSRLNEEIRVKRGLTYGINSSVAAYHRDGPVQVVTFTKSESASEAVEIILSEMRKLADKPVDSDELHGTKQYMIGLFPFSLETNRRIAQQVSDSRFYGLGDDYISGYCRKIADVTPADIQRVAEQYFSSDNAVVTVLGDAAKLSNSFSSASIRKIDEYI